MSKRQAKSHAEYLELVFLEVDGELSKREVRELDEHTSSCAECRAVRGELPLMHSILEEIKVEVHPDLAARVLGNLPPAVWEMRRPSTWRVAAIAFVGLFGAAYALSFQSDPLGEALPWLGTVVAMAELFRSAALAGAGLLGASWSSVGLALGDVLSRSTTGWVTFGIFVLGIDVLFVRYLWRLSRREALARSGKTRPRS